MSINYYGIVLYSPQKGMPSGIQFPLLHTRLDGPSNSKPRSHEYVATAPFANDSSVNVTELCAGAPGKLQISAEKENREKKKPLIIW
jgi:hypothetical protein